VRAVVIAAGVGSRLRPLTERYAKPVLPIDGRPVIATLLRELTAAAVHDVTVVVGHRGDGVRRLLGDGRAFGVELRYATQEEPLGSAHAVAVAAVEPPYLAVGADSVFASGEIGRFLAAYDASGAAGAVAVRTDPGGVVTVVDGAVTRFGTEGATHAAAPLWAVGTALALRVAALPGEPPHELAQAFREAIDAGERVEAVEVSAWRDLTSPLDLLLENFPYLKDLLP